jgi:hypothetical protein
MIERQTNRKVKVLRTDNGGEFCSAVFKIIVGRKELSGTTPYRILVSKTVWPSA